jgi:hypothetical protein
VNRLRIQSNGLLLAALALGFIIVVTGDGGARTGSAGALPSAIASAANETPMLQPPSAKAPTHKRPTASPSPKHPSDQASRKQRFRQGDEPPAKRGGTVYLTFDDGPSQYTPAILNVLRATHSTATSSSSASDKPSTPPKRPRSGPRAAISAITHTTIPI